MRPLPRYSIKSKMLADKDGVGTRPGVSVGYPRSGMDDEASEDLRNRVTTEVRN